MADRNLNIIKDRLYNKLSYGELAETYNISRCRASQIVSTGFRMLIRAYSHRIRKEQNEKTK